jgi:chromosome segregation ATPase
MSSPPATAQDGIPRSAGAPIRHPLALTALGLAFLAATLGAFGLGSRLTSSSAAESKGSRLAAGSLALLHARLEQQALMASLLSSGNAELTRLDAEVKALKKKLTEVTSQVKKEEASLASLTEQKTNSESRRQALFAEEPRLKKIQQAFDAALAKQKAADAAIQTAKGGTGSLPDLEAWQAEWKSVSKDALENIEKARASLHALQTKAAPWSNAKDTMTPEQRSDLISQRAKTEDTLETARKTADDAKKKLSILIESQRQQLEKAAAAAPPP